MKRQYTVLSVFELPTVTLIPNGIHHPPIEDGRLLPELR